METVKLILKTSPQDNYKYYIYRDTEQSNLPDDLTALNKLTPVLIIDETKQSKTAKQILQDMSIDSTAINMPGYKPFTTIYPYLCDSIHPIDITIIYNSSTQPNPSCKYDLNFNDDGTIKDCTYTAIDGTKTTQTDITTINKDIIINNKNIFISNTKLDNYMSLKIEHYMSVIEIEDSIDNSLSGYQAGGQLTAANLNVQTNSIKLANSTSISSLILRPYETQDASIQMPITYYYKAVAQNASGISMPSCLQSISLMPNIKDIQYFIETCEFYHGVNNENNIWKTIAPLVVEGGSITLNDPNSTDFLLYGTDCCDTIIIFGGNEINVNTSLISTNNNIAISLPNVWTNNGSDNFDFYNRRIHKAFRATAFVGSGTNMIPGPTGVEYFTQGTDVIPIEKIVILRKKYIDQAQKTITSSIFTTQTPTQFKKDYSAGASFGTDFTTLTDGLITKVRLYTGSQETGIHKVRIWNVCDSSIIAGPYDWNITAGTQGWQEFTLPTPLQVYVNAEYIIDITSGPDGYYASSNISDTNKVTGNNYIRILNCGVSNTKMDNKMPTFDPTNYFRDIVFVPQPLSPIKIDDSAAETAHTYIKGQGVYYDDSIHSKLPVNESTATTPTSIITPDSTFDKLTFRSNVTPGTSYLYTVYLFDCFKKMSDPTTIKVDVPNTTTT